MNYFTILITQNWKKSFLDILPLSSFYFKRWIVVLKPYLASKKRLSKHNTNPLRILRSAKRASTTDLSKRIRLQLHCAYHCVSPIAYVLWITTLHAYHITLQFKVSPLTCISITSTWCAFQLEELYFDHQLWYCPVESWFRTKLARLESEIKIRNQRLILELNIYKLEDDHSKSNLMDFYKHVFK